MAQTLVRNTVSWPRIRELMRDAAVPLSAREIADALEMERQEVGTALSSMARRQKVIRVVTVKAGPLLWKLPEAPR